MKDSTINTEGTKTQHIKHEKNDTNNHEYSFFNYSGNTNLQYNTNISGYTTFNEFDCSEKKLAKYCINLDNYECTVITKNNCRQLDKYGTDKILITKHNNNKTKYRYGYVITFENEEFCEVFAKTTNKETNTLHLKLYNHQLYTSDWTHRFLTLMSDLNFQELEHNEIHIAVDGEDILKQKKHFRDYFKNSSVVNGNGNLKIDGDYFNKNLSEWETFNVGAKKSGKTVGVYNKSNELQKSKKDYIKRFWKDNGLLMDKPIGRFELRLTSRKLKVLKIGSLHDLNNPAILSSIFQSEVEDWLNLYRVSVTLLKQKGKYYAIKKGKRLKLIDYNSLPQSSIKVEYIQLKKDETREAKRTITFNLKELQKATSNVTISAFVKVIRTIAQDYELKNHLISKLREAMHSNQNNRGLLRLQNSTMYW